MQVTGQVERVIETPTKYGSLFGVIVNGTRYGAGKTSQGVAAGDWVRFSTSQNEKGYWDIEKGTLEPVPAPSGKSEQATPVRANPVSNDTRQDSIIYQSSRKDALHLIQVLMDGGLIDFGKAKGEAKIAIVETYLDKFTEHFISEVKANTPSPSFKADPIKTLADLEDDNVFPPLK